MEIAKAHTVEDALFQAELLTHIVNEYGNLDMLSDEQCDIVAYNMMSAANSWLALQGLLHSTEQKLKAIEGK